MHDDGRDPIKLRYKAGVPGLPVGVLGLPEGGVGHDGIGIADKAGGIFINDCGETCRIEEVIWVNEVQLGVLDIDNGGTHA